MIDQALGRYCVLQKIGEGVMGVVYLAHYSELSRDVALKVLREEASGDAMRMQRFKREAQVLASLIPLRPAAYSQPFSPIQNSS